MASWWAYVAALALCLLHVALSVTPVTKHSQTAAARDDASYPLTAGSNLALFSVQNTTQGLRVSIHQQLDKACHFTPQGGITFDDVFLPEACSVAPCSTHLLVKERGINETLFQYVVGVPANETLLLLRFQYHLQSGLFELVEHVLVNSSTNGCSPTATGYVAEGYMILCANLGDKTANVLFINNLDDLPSVVFNSAIDTKFLVTFPIEDISFLDYPFSERRIINIIFPIETQQLALVEPGNFYSYIWTVPDCEGTIHQLRLRSDADIDSTIPYIIYCDTNYVVVDFVFIESPELVSSHYYNETGYPEICRNENNSITAEIAVFKGDTNTTISYNRNNFTIPGVEVDLVKSTCFGFKTKLFYLYSDAEVGVILVDLIASNWSVLECQSQSCDVQVLNNRYIVLQETNGMNNNVTVRLFDAFTLKGVQELNVNHTLDLFRLFSLPLPQPQPSNGPNLLTILLPSTIGGSVLLLIILVTVGAIVYHVWKKNSTTTTAIEQEPNNDRSHLVPGIL